MRAETEKAEAALLSLEGVDSEQVIAEIQSYKDAIATAKENFDRQMTVRDQNAWLDKKLDEYGVNSQYARKQLTADIMAEDSGVVWQDGEFYGFDDYMRKAKETDGSLYPTEEPASETKLPRFTGPVVPSTKKENNIFFGSESRSILKIF